MYVTTEQWDALSTDKKTRTAAANKKLTEILVRIAKRPRHMQPIQAAWSDFVPHGPWQPQAIYVGNHFISPQRVIKLRARTIGPTKEGVSLVVYHRKAAGEVGYAMCVRGADDEVYFNVSVRSIIKHFIAANMSYDETVAALDELDAIVTELEELYPA